MCLEPPDPLDSKNEGVWTQKIQMDENTSWKLQKSLRSVPRLS